MTKEQRMTNQERRWTIYVCDAPHGGLGICGCEGEWVTREGEEVFDADCKAERIVEVIDCAALEELADEWEAVPNGPTVYDEGIRDGLGQAARELRALTQPTEPDHKEADDGR